MALMDNIPGWKVFSAGIGLAALALVGYFAYVWFVQGPDDLKELQDHAVEVGEAVVVVGVEADGQQVLRIDAV